MRASFLKQTATDVSFRAVGQWRKFVWIGIKVKQILFS
jgi:hypothetical protein